MLAGAFSEFIHASAKLEQSYRDLQVEVVELSQALLERNQALAESRSRNLEMAAQLEGIVQAMPCGVVVTDAEGTIRLANTEAGRLLHFEPAATPVPCLQDLLPAELGSLAVFREQGDVEQEIELAVAGTQRWLAVRGVVLEGPGADPYDCSHGEAVFVLRDVSARKRFEVEREKARDAVALAQVSAMLAHEIRNPLAGLELFAGFIAEDPAKSPEWIGHMRAGIRSLSGIVNNVLALHGSAPAITEALDLCREIRVAVEFLQPLAGQAGLQLCHACESAGLRVRSNRSALQQVLFNLCANAFRHTPPGGQVHLRCLPHPFDAARVQVEVSDTGTGIAPEVLPYLFQVGCSGSGTTSGLGLAVCRRLLAQGDATIAVHSQPGVGTTFTVELPRA